MGRTKVPIKKIEGDRQRSTCFNKRKAGLFKKAMELSILCDVEVTLMVRSAAGAFTVYSSESLDAALANYRRATGQVTASNNKDYNRLYNKGAAAAGGAASEDEDEGEGKKKPVAPPPRKKAAPGGGKRKKKGSDDDEEYGDEDEDEYRTEPPKREGAKGAAPMQEVFPNAFLNPASSGSGVSPGSGAASDFSVFLPTSQWSAELEQHLVTSGNSNAPLALPTPAAPAPAPPVVVGASVVSDRKRSGNKRQATKKTKKTGPALSVDTSQQGLTEVKLELGGPGSPPPVMGFSLTPTSGGSFLPSFGLGIFPSTPFPTTPSPNL